MKISPLLAKIFVCISFAWDVHKLGYLEQSITAVLSYPTVVDVCVVTNAPDKLERVFADWDMMNLWVCDESWAEEDSDPNQYALLWRHRAVMKAASKGSAHYTTYVYMEDDTQVPWRAMKAWARATPALELVNLTYGFYRTEVSPLTGELVMMDLIVTVNISQAHTLHIQGYGAFVELPQPYFGMWLATHAQLKHFMEHPTWRKEVALTANTPHGGGYPERTTWMIQYVNVPKGFLTSSVIRYNIKTTTLAPEARIVHLRNGYSDIVDEPLSTIPLVSALAS